MSTCTHRWSMTHVRGGYLVVEGCRHCNARACFFSTEASPPVDDYHEGQHYWTYLGSSQAVKFDLKCAGCGEVVDLSEMTGLMLSTCRDPDCEVGRLARRGRARAPGYTSPSVRRQHPRVPESASAMKGIAGPCRSISTGTSRTRTREIIVRALRASARASTPARGSSSPTSALTEMY